MKKRIEYNIKFILSTHTGEIFNSHCECPSGCGPHGTCKHVIAAWLILVDFVDSGNLKILESCTEQLQSFHRPKKLHSGSPKKAEKMGIGLTEEDSDPRPLHLRNRESYSDDVLNTVTNFCYFSGLDITLRYCQRKADLQAAAVDHNYFGCNFLEY
jgi:hypothetical protein